MVGTALLASATLTGFPAHGWLLRVPADDVQACRPWPPCIVPRVTRCPVKPAATASATPAAARTSPGVTTCGDTGQASGTISPRNGTIVVWSATSRRRSLARSARVASEPAQSSACSETGRPVLSAITSPLAASPAASSGIPGALRLSQQNHAASVKAPTVPAILAAAHENDNRNPPNQTPTAVPSRRARRSRTSRRRPGRPPPTTASVADSTATIRTSVTPLSWPEYGQALRSHAGRHGEIRTPGHRPSNPHRRRSAPSGRRS